MTVTTKAALAAELGITKARVSQYVKRGMPVRSDGKLDRESAVKWISDNHPDYGRERQVGVKRASELARAVKPVRTKPARRDVVAPNPVDAALLNATAEIVARSSSVAHAAANRLGLPVRTAFLLCRIITDRLEGEAESFLDRVGVSRDEDAFGAAVGPLYWSLQPDWRALAGSKGVSFDEDAWDREAVTLMEGAHA